MSISLGKSGLKVSKVILGAMGYGDPTQGEKWVLSEDKALPLLYHAYKRGINTWDTANVYSQGVSEEIIGKAIKKYEIPREHLVLLTKCYFGVDPKVVEGGQLDIVTSGTNDGWMVNRVGLSRKAIFDAVDASIKRSVLLFSRLEYRVHCN
jgi:aryl-alcohol dehydrogenase-like predicted oxidoreductase